MVRSSPDVQQNMLNMAPVQPKRQKDGQPASGGSHGCLDPHDATNGHDEQGFCACFLWPFNDRHFVFHFGPRPVAFLLRDYGALCEAQKRLPEARFEHVYAARKRKIERDILPEISDELHDEACEVMKTLPSPPALT
jgi:hypothetical protein